MKHHYGNTAQSYLKSKKDGKVVGFQSSSKQKRLNQADYWSLIMNALIKIDI